MTCTAHLTPADIACAATLRARFPACDGACEAGRSACQCSRHAPAEAATELGLDDTPHGHTHGLDTLPPRWRPRLNAALLVALLAILAFAQQLDTPLDTPPEPAPTSAASTPATPEPRDGIPPELLAEARP